VERDLAFVVPEGISAEAVITEINRLKDPLLKRVSLFDVYTGKGVAKGKRSLAYNLTFSTPDRTLTDEEVDSSVRKMVKEVEKKLGAKLRA
jgi:phenylalanyl-tRNA synthetase beta chain